MRRYGIAVRVLAGTMQHVVLFGSVNLFARGFSQHRRSWSCRCVRDGIRNWLRRRLCTNFGQPLRRPARPGLDELFSGQLRLFPVPIYKRGWHQGWITAEWGVGEQSASPLLLADESRPQTAHHRALEVGAPLGRCRPRAAKDIAVRLWHILHSRLRSLLIRTRRDARGTALLDNLVRDIRYACRSFLRAPLVALTIVMTVGLGLGLVAVVFTILNAFDLSRGRGAQPARAVRGRTSAIGRRGARRASRARSMTRSSARRRLLRCLREHVGHQRLDRGPAEGGPLVTGNFFHVLGVSAARGRTLTPSDDEPGGRPVIVLSHRAWSQHFAGDPGVLDRTVLRERRAVPRCRRDAGRLSRTRAGRCAGLLGAALAP